MNRMAYVPPGAKHFVASCTYDSAGNMIVHTVEKEPEPDVQVVHVVRVARPEPEPEPSPVMHVRVAPEIQLRTRDHAISGVALDPSRGQTIGAAIDQAFDRASRDNKDIVVYLGDRVAAVAFVGGDGRVKVARLIDDPE